MQLIFIPTLREGLAVREYPYTADDHRRCMDGPQGGEIMDLYIALNAVGNWARSKRLTGRFVLEHR